MIVRDTGEPVQVICPFCDGEGARKATKREARRLGSDVVASPCTACRGQGRLEAALAEPVDVDPDAVRDMLTRGRA